jgi:hypothetical protein
MEEQKKVTYEELGVGGVFVFFVATRKLSARTPENAEPFQCVRRYNGWKGQCRRPGFALLLAPVPCRLRGTDRQP